MSSSIFQVRLVLSFQAVPVEGPWTFSSSAISPPLYGNVSTQEHCSWEKQVLCFVSSQILPLLFLKFSILKLSSLSTREPYLSTLLGKSWTQLSSGSSLVTSVGVLMMGDTGAGLPIPKKARKRPHTNATISYSFGCFMMSCFTWKRMIKEEYCIYTKYSKVIKKF